MTSFEQFCARTKMRHDFADQIQVRYRHSDGETYDTWVSGEEVMQRLRSEAAERRLRGLSSLNWEAIREAKDTLPEEGKERFEDHVKDRLADGLEDALGDNVIGESLADAVRGGDRGEDDDGALWRQRLRDEAFREKVLELAWINLRGSFPEDDNAGTRRDAADDWV